MYQQYQHCMAVAAAIQLGPKTALMRFPAPTVGSIVQVALVSRGAVNNNGDAVFDVNVNGTTIFTDQSTRPKILSGFSTGFTGIAKGVALVEAFDEITVDLDSVPAGGVGGPLYLIVVIDNSLTVSRYVKQMYVGGMGRVPTNTEQTNGEASLNTALAQNTLAIRTACADLATLVFGSAEYTARARTDTQFVSDLYAGILGRGADSAGLAANLATLITQGGTNTRADLRGAFIGSAEHINVRIAEFSGNVYPYGDAAFIGGIPVDLAGLSNNQILKYNSSTGKFVAANDNAGSSDPTMAGDVSGTASANSVDKLKGVPMVGTLGAGQTWAKSGSNLVPVAVPSVALFSNGDAVLAQQNAPPGSPSAAQAYLVGTAGSGAWAGHSNQIAVYDGSAWAFVTPSIGWRVYNRATYIMMAYTENSGWVNWSAALDVAPWTPASLTGLSGWFVGDNASGSDGASTNSMTDDSGAGHGLNNTYTAAQGRTSPELRYNAIGTHKAWEFDGNTDALGETFSGAGWSALNGGGSVANWAIWMVMKVPDIASNLGRRVIGDQSGYVNLQIYQNLNMIWSSYGPSISLTQAMPALGTWFLMELRGTGSAISFRIANNTASTGGNGLFTYDASAVYIASGAGVGGTTADRSAHEFVAEMVTVNAGGTAIPSGSITSARNYFNSKYGVTV